MEVIFILKFQVKVGASRKVKRDSLKVIQDNKYMTARTEELINLFYNNEPEKYSLSGKKETLQISDTEVKSLLSEFRRLDL